jgi:hypothetical protein
MKRIKMIAVLIMTAALVISMMNVTVAEELAPEAGEIAEEIVVEIVEEAVIEIPAEPEVAVEAPAEPEAAPAAEPVPEENEIEEIGDIEDGEAIEDEDFEDEDLGELVTIEDEMIPLSDGLMEEEILDGIATIKLLGDAFKYGDTVTIIAELEGFESADLSLDWEYSLDGEEWNIAAQTTELSYEYTLSAENAAYVWRLTVRAA